jgi:hypothetical protein
VSGKLPEGEAVILASSDIHSRKQGIEELSMSSGYECLEQLEGDSTLSQGDVIVWEEPQDFQSKAAVIVTADCDLAKGKHWGRVTVIPMVPVRNYLEEVYLPNQLALLEQDLAALFAKAVHQTLKGGADTPSDDALESLVGLDALPSPLDTSEQAKVVHALLRHTRGLTKSMTSAEALDQALRIRNPDVKALSASRIRTFLEKPPGDCMVLPQLPGLAPGMHVAFLRALREVRDRDIARKTSEITPNRAKRIGRLVPVLRYRLTQMLAQVFSDIGLPDEYEANLKADTIKFVESITQPQKGQA